MVRSDLGHNTDMHEIMMALDQSIRVALAEPILDKLRMRGTRSTNLDTLEGEIKNGKCNIGYVNEEPMRTAFVVTFLLRRNKFDGDDRFLVKVGECMKNDG